MRLIIRKFMLIIIQEAKNKNKTRAPTQYTSPQNLCTSATSSRRLGVTSGRRARHRDVNITVRGPGDQPVCTWTSCLRPCTSRVITLLGLAGGDEPPRAIGRLHKAARYTPRLNMPGREHNNTELQNKEVICVRTLFRGTVWVESRGLFTRKCFV